MKSSIRCKASGSASTLLVWLTIAIAPLSVAWARQGAGPNPYPWNHPNCPCATVLHSGSAELAGLVASRLAAIDDTVKAFIADKTAPGAVVLVARRGVVAKWQAYGDAALYTDAKFDKMAHPVPMARDTIFDLASVSKLFTAVAVMQLWDEGKLDLDAPVAKYLPQFGVNGKQDVTVRELLTHTSGFRPDPPIPLYKIPGSRADRIDNVLQQPLEYPPGTHYVYSDMNFITLGALIEKLSGEREDQFVHQHITDPLHMTSTMYDPPASLKPRIAATEYQPWTNRGMLRGQVDDENAWALGGVAGHAGVFSDARDLAVFGQMMLDDGTYDGARILSARAVKLMETDWTSKFPLAGCGDPRGATVPGSCVGNVSRVYSEDATGLGWSIDRGYLMGALSGPHT
ncbi:MAG: serine hydrolase domain-containing protein, partial [Rhodanobacteraceae bacterium]